MECLEYEVRGRQTIYLGPTPVCADVVTTVVAINEMDALKRAHETKNISSTNARSLGVSARPLGTFGPVEYADKEAEKRFHAQLDLAAALSR